MRERWEDWFQPGETLLWEGAPAPGMREIPKNLFFTAFGIPFFGAGLFVMGLGLGSLFGLVDDWGARPLALGVFMTAFGIPFFGAGAGMMFGPWLHVWFRPKRVRYALTDRNGYIASRYWNRTMEVFPIRPDSQIETAAHRDGTMSIQFHFRPYKDSDGDDRVEKKGFEYIADGHDVYQMIRQIQSDLKGAPE